MKYQKTSIYGIQKAGKSIGLLLDIIKLDEPCNIAVVCKDKKHIRHIDDFLKEYLPYGIKYKIITQVGD